MRRTWSALTQDEWVELHGQVRWITRQVRRAFAPDHFNYAFLMNLDRHVHLHVIPRYVGTRELAGVTFADPDYPDSHRGASESELAGEEVIAAVEAALCRP